jgi:hypothetical protein
VTAAVLAMAAFAAPNASAATEVGNDCEANATVHATLFQMVNEPGGLAASVPSAGVATKWKVKYIPSFESFPEKLKVLRPTAGPHDFTTVAESAVGIVGGGENVFDTRIPVQAGDRFGTYGTGPAGTLNCETGHVGGVLASFGGETAVGSTRTFSEEAFVFRAAVTATVEADADGDGYGDETQDKCPQSAAVQAKCPEVKLHAGAKARRRSIAVRVSTSSEATVTVGGQVGWGYKPKPGHHTTRLIVALSGGRRVVKAGEVATFRVGLPRLVRARLQKLSPQESLKAKIAVSAASPAGRTSVKRLTVKLPGQG